MGYNRLNLLKYFIPYIALLGILAVAPNASANQYNVYYGHLHNHSSVSDGTGSPSAAYQYARDVAGLDFFSLADHAEQISASEWSTIMNAANTYDEDGVFVAFWGFEWSSNSYGHVAVFNTDEYCSSAQTDTNNFSKLVNWLSTRNGAAFFNHPGRQDAYNSEFNHFSTPSDKFVGMELWNKNDAFNTYYYNDGYYSNDNNKGYFDEALARGFKIGASGSDDNHDGTWGTRNDFRLAILSDNLTRASLWDAIQARRFFTTLDKNIALSFEINGQQMGSTVTGGTLPCIIHTSDGDSEIFTEIQLFRNGTVDGIWNPGVTSPVISFNLSAHDREYYYIKVTQADGDEAISSPIWIEGEIVPDGDPPTPDPMTWASAPHAVDSYSITMTATQASDVSGVEYYFTCVSAGGHDSGWQTDTTYTDVGLSPKTQYTYTVKARDLSENLNETGESTPASIATPDIENSPPQFTSNPIIEGDAIEGALYNSIIADNASDADPLDRLVFSKISGPVWLVIATDGSLSGTPHATDVGLNTWTVRVEDLTGDFDEAILQINVNSDGQDIDYNADGESTAKGNVFSGSYLNTMESDNTYEAIAEQLKSGKWSQLDHTWIFHITSGASIMFLAEAYHSANIEGDDFVFSYSIDNLVFNEMFTVTKTNDSNTYQSYELPTSTSGTVYIRVKDTDNTRNHTRLDTLFVDHILIRTSGTIQEPAAAFSPKPPNGSMDIALDILLEWSAGAGAAWHDVYFGTESGNLSAVSLGQAQTNFDPGALVENTTYYWRVDEGNIAGKTAGAEWTFTTKNNNCIPTTVHIESIMIDQLRGSAGKLFGQATVTLVDNCGSPVSGAEVTGHFTGSFINEPVQTVTSDQNGRAVFVTHTELKKPVVSFVVDDVIAGELIWTP